MTKTERFWRSCRETRIECPAGRAHCAWGGHFVACVPVLRGSTALVGMHTLGPILR
jgi:hypothetical protein